MPGPPLAPFQSDTTLPARVDVVVIGGGIIGAVTALELAERGISVLLCEKGVIGGEQSSRNWGWVRIALRDPREVALMAESARLWRGMDRRTGRATGYRGAGILYLAENARKQAGYESWAAHLAPHGIAGGMVSGARLRRLLPDMETAGMAGLFTPDDGRAEPQLAAPAIAAAARDRGAHVLTGCAVRSLDLAAGRVAGVVTERGRVACDAAVLAGGAWSRLFAGNAGVELAQLKVLNSVLRTTPVAGGPGVTLGAEGFALRRREDGGFTVSASDENTVDLVPDSFRLARAFLPALAREWRSLRFRLSGRWCTEWRQERHWSADEETPFERERILDPAPSRAALGRAWDNARRAIPALRGAGIAQSWAGMIDVTPDAVPVIGAAHGPEGLFVSTGYSGHGFGIAPGAGRLTADLVTGATPLVDPHDFRPSRFSRRGGSAEEPADKAARGGRDCWTIPAPCDKGRDNRRHP